MCVIDIFGVIILGFMLGSTTITDHFKSDTSNIDQ